MTHPSTNAPLIEAADGHKTPSYQQTLDWRSTANELPYRGGSYVVYYNHGLYAILDYCFANSPLMAGSEEYFAGRAHAWVDTRQHNEWDWQVPKPQWWAAL